MSFTRSSGGGSSRGNLHTFLKGADVSSMVLKSVLDTAYSLINFGGSEG